MTLSNNNIYDFKNYLRFSKIVLGDSRGYCGLAEAIDNYCIIKKIE